MLRGRAWTSPEIERGCLLLRFLITGRVCGPQTLLLAQKPHGGPLALHALARAKLILGAVLALGLTGGPRSAALLANNGGLGRLFYRSRTGVGGGMAQGVIFQSIVFQTVVVFLNGVGGGQQFLKELLVNGQVMSIRWHGIAGEDKTPRLTLL